MRLILLWLCAPCVTLVCGIFEGTCPRKDPPPGVLVLSPGSNLVITCKGHVTVDGVKVNMDKDMVHATSKKPSENEELYSLVVGKDAGPAYTASPTTHVVQPHGGEVNVAGDDDEDEEEDEEEEEEEGDAGSRVTRGLKPRFQWMWNRKLLEVGGRDGGEIRLERSGSSLSLLSVREQDSGRYTCHHRGTEAHSVKVVVSGNPEPPTLSCSKKSPSSKIRCEWQPERPLTSPVNCYLMLTTSPSETFLQVQCAYSPRLSRCWCALHHDEDAMRTVHMAYLCVTSITGNATSSLLPFTPLNILKPDPPSRVTVTQVVGHKMWLRVTWNFPISWKTQDKYYELIYEVKYVPLGLSTPNEQKIPITGQRSYTITDALPGVPYLIQVRTKEEYDGHWSDWSAPVRASCWTAPEPDDELIPTTFPSSWEEGSGTDDYIPGDAVPVVTEVEWSYHILWICGSFLGLSLCILAAYLFRHKSRLMSKLHLLSAVCQSSGPSELPVSTPAAPEGQALGPTQYNNATYFLIRAK